MAKVSVIIPVYNVEKYLRECLDSVINQTLSDIEIICVNDGSTDNSLAILEEYAQKDTRIKIISKRNEGAGKARQAAIKKASGEYLAFLDGDDYYKSDFVEKMYASAKKIIPILQFAILANITLRQTYIQIFQNLFQCKIFRHLNHFVPAICLIIFLHRFRIGIGIKYIKEVL